MMTQLILRATMLIQQAIKEHGIEPVSRPDMDIIEIGREVGLKFYS
jgi:FKBP-type peptidyl-prolyl cis-trans isomerase (trigger factor)